MRFSLNLQKSGDKEVVVPFNYQYPLSAWIYKTFDRADPAFARWLHEQGYAFSGKKKFKLFTFSHLHLPEFKLDKARQGFVLLGDTARLVLSFHMEEASERFVTGLFQEQDCIIAGQGNKACFRVSSVERQPEPEWGGETAFRTLSPICVARPERRNGKLYAQYLAPEDGDYENYFFDHLIRKYITAQSMRNGQVKIVREQRGDFSFELLGPSQSKLITVKAGTPAETKVRGYLYDFKLQAPPELLRFGCEAGFGEKNSLGMGCVEAVDERQD